MKVKRIFLILIEWPKSAHLSKRVKLNIVIFYKNFKIDKLLRTFYLLI